MATIENTASATDRRTVLRCLAWTVPSAMAGTLTVWLVSRLGDVDLVVGTGAEARTVGWVSVAVVSALAATAGTLLLLVMERWLPHGRAWWTAVATAVLVLSLGGPFGATSTEAVIVLAAMHVVVWLALVGTAWRRG